MEKEKHNSLASSSASGTECLCIGRISENCVISIIIPVYQCVDYLEETLVSVRNQNLANIEIICVDDGSTDGSKEKLMEIAKKDARISVYSQTHLGPSDARNAGIERATGKYLYFMDSDDILMPCALEKMISLAEEQDLEVLCFDAERFYDDSCTETELQFRPNYHRRGKYPICTCGEALFSEFCENNEYYVPVWLMLLKRSLIMDHSIRFYSGIIHEDNVFSYQVMIRATRAGYLGEVLYRRRIRANSIRTSGDWLASSYGFAVGSNILWKDYMDHRSSLREETAKWSVVRFNVMLQHSLEDFRKAVEEGKDADIPGDDSPFRKLIAQNVKTEEKQKKKLLTKDKEIQKLQKELLTKDKEIQKLQKELEAKKKELQELYDSRLYKILLRIRRIYRMVWKHSSS